MFSFAPLSERNSDTKKDGPALPVGQRVKKVADPRVDANGIRPLTGIPRQTKQVPLGSIGTVVKVKTDYIKIHWDGMDMLSEELVPDPYYCCYDPIDQLSCLERVE